MNHRLLPLLSLLLALGSAGALAQEHEHAASPAPPAPIASGSKDIASGSKDPTLEAAGGLGSVHFPTTCRADAAADFDRATALLHSFGYELARQAFAGVAARDPGCAMAQWGIAMSFFHPVWAPPTAAELDQGRAAADKAVAMTGAGERERGYIGAIAAFYRDAARLDHRTRAAAYRDAMADVVKRFPDDHEASIFYALSLLGSAPPNDPSFSQQRQAAGILNRLLPLEPRHPGLAHYLIHAFDYPQLASLALPAARAYAKIAPASPHAQHMPSHIFTRLGLWEESIQSNLASEATADALVARLHPGAAAFDSMHALDYLEYAYLQTGQDAKAKAVLERIFRATAFDEPNFAAGYALTAVQARYALERRQWQDAAGLDPPKAQLPWDRYSYALASTQFARSLGGARSGDLAVAQDGLAQLAAIHDALVKTPPAGPYDWAGEIESLRLAAAGWVAQAQGKPEAALALVRSAADLQDKVGKHPVTPGELLPARELLGDLLLELRRPSDALKEYETSLAAAPNRLNGLYNAALAAGQAGDAAKARAYYAQVVAQCSRADPARPEVVQARSAAKR
jgi:tetratricopeptide (TPR) repeat protein